MVLINCLKTHKMLPGFKKKRQIVWPILCAKVSLNVLPYVNNTNISNCFFLQTIFQKLFYENLLQFQFYHSIFLNLINQIPEKKPYPSSILYV